ncbi:MAG: cell division ATP-binding protein FtsE [Collinsella sp.]|nr:cell division ATP-binding protein FtsE [Collinsella sp.]
MGNHFRTSGDEQPVPTAPTPGEPMPTPSVPDPLRSTDLLDDAPAAAGPGVQPPASQIPDPLAPVSHADVFMPAAPQAGPDPSLNPATFRTRDGSAVPSTDADERRQVADLDAALASPDFTTVFAPISEDRDASQRAAARQAGVEPVILMEHLTKVYPAQPNKAALDDINLEIYPGEFVFLVGHSGSGKTTLLNTILRNVKPSSGRVMVAGQDLMRIKNRRIPFLRRQIGAVFQDYKLLPNKTAFENVAFALQCIGKPRGVIRAQVPEVLRLVGLGEKMNSLPDQLSGGEQQRVSVARAMVNRPPLLICDEPTGNLDPAISLGIMKLLERINRTGTTVIVATHDREMVDSMHRRVIALEGGRVIRDQERGGYGNYGAY